MSTGKKQVFQVFIRPPDHVKCEILSDRLAELGMRLRQPRSIGDCDLCSLPAGSGAQASTPGAVVAGGFDQTSFYYDTGIDVIRPSDGAQTRDIWRGHSGVREHDQRAAHGPLPTRRAAS